MGRNRQKRISTIEQDVLPQLCNCRITTAYHNANCLLAILKGQSIPCPAHDFRFLGVFLTVQQPEPVLYSDHQFCMCVPMNESDGEDCFESSFERQRREFRAQRRLMMKYLRASCVVYQLEYPHAAILSKATTDENGRPDLRSIPLEDVEPFKLAIAHYELRQKWMADTGQALPTSMEILFLNCGRFYPNARKSL